MDKWELLCRRIQPVVPHESPAFIDVLRVYFTKERVRQPNEDRLRALGQSVLLSRLCMRETGLAKPLRMRRETYMPTFASHYAARSW